MMSVLDHQPTPRVLIMPMEEPGAWKGWIKSRTWVGAALCTWGPIVASNKKGFSHTWDSKGQPTPRVGQPTPRRVGCVLVMSVLDRPTPRVGLPCHEEPRALSSSYDPTESRPPRGSPGPRATSSKHRPSSSSSNKPRRRRPMGAAGTAPECRRPPFSSKPLATSSVEKSCCREPGHSLHCRHNNRALCAETRCEKEPAW